MGGEADRSLQFKADLCEKPAGRRRHWCRLRHGVRRAAATAVLAALALPLSVTASFLFAAPGHVDRPTCVAAASPSNAPAAQQLAVSCDDKGKVRRWKVGAEPVTEDHKYNEHGSKASFVAASLPGQKVLSASYNGKVIVSKLFPQPGDQPAEFDKHVTMNPNPQGTPEVWVVAASFDGSRAISATNGGQILLWNPGNVGQAPAEYKAYGEPIGGLAFVPKNPAGQETHFVSTHADGYLRLWRIGAPAAPEKSFHHRNRFPVNAVAVARDGRTVVTGSFDMKLRIWDLNGPENQNPTVIPNMHDDLIWRVAIGPNDDRFASAGEDGKIRVYNMAGQEFTDDDNATQDYKQEPSGVMGVAFVTDTLIVYTTTESKNNEPDVKRWDIGHLRKP